MTTTRTNRDRLRFDRLDRLATVALLWLVVGVTAAYPLFITLDWALRRQVTLTGVPVEVDKGAAGAGEVVGGMTEAHVLVGEVSAGHLALLLVGPVLVVAAAVWGAVLVGRFLRDLAAGTPFDVANVTRLRVVALLLMLVPVGAGLVYSIARAEIMDAAGAFGFIVSFTPTWLVAGLLVAAVAQAFAAGSRLQHDVDGLV
ncbi:DUF2975 domain-containing protein [uncultured Serinicoccus sp.]|uniref:DUF2975 domain-containing protein n=1 Tax=uncultured Serinicoccus sp. TaxID=735514 RepID=UPI00262384CF|nr:DUF2975 domain-containing protein [uncultured Serinicoccus sp.]